MSRAPRVVACVCGHLGILGERCDVCTAKARHEPHCRFRKSVECPIGVECEHGRDVCPVCDPCTCGRLGVVVDRAIRHELIRYFREAS